MAASTDEIRARAFAQAYVRLVEALLREGVVEETARNEARLTAMLELMEEDPRPYDPARGPCSKCGRG